MQTKFLLIAPLALLFLAVSPDTAEAKRGIVLWGHGEDITSVADIPDGDGEKLGYMYSCFSLFFLNVWTWDGRFVVKIDDTTYSELDQDPNEIAATLGISASAVKKPFSYSVPAFMYVLVGLAMFGVFRLKQRGAEERRANELQKAMFEERKQQRQAG